MAYKVTDFIKFLTDVTEKSEVFDNSFDTVKLTELPAKPLFQLYKIIKNAKLDNGQYGCTVTTTIEKYNIVLTEEHYSQVLTALENETKLGSRIFSYALNEAKDTEDESLDCEAVLEALENFEFSEYYQCVLALNDAQSSGAYFSKKYTITVGSDVFVLQESDYINLFSEVSTVLLKKIKDIHPKDSQDVSFNKEYNELPDEKDLVDGDYLNVSVYNLTTSFKKMAAYYVVYTENLQKNNDKQQIEVPPAPSLDAYTEHQNFLATFKPFAKIPKPPQNMTEDKKKNNDNVLNKQDENENKAFDQLKKDWLKFSKDLKKLFQNYSLNSVFEYLSNNLAKKTSLKEKINFLSELIGEIKQSKTAPNGVNEFLSKITPMVRLKTALHALNKHYQRRDALIALFVIIPVLLILLAATLGGLAAKAIFINLFFADNILKFASYIAGKTLVLSGAWPMVLNIGAIVVLTGLALVAVTAVGGLIRHFVEKRRVNSCDDSLSLLEKLGGEADYINKVVFGGEEVFVEGKTTFFDVNNKESGIITSIVENNNENSQKN